MNGWILFLVCGLIDYIARKTKNKRTDIVNWLGKDWLQKIYDLADVYQNLSLQGRLAGLEVHERFYEIGSHSGLKETEDYFLAREEA